MFVPPSPIPPFVIYIFVLFLGKVKGDLDTMNGGKASIGYGQRGVGVGGGGYRELRINSNHLILFLCFHIRDEGGYAGYILLDV